MVFTVPTFENIDFEIPDGKGKSLTISVPPLDCMAPSDVAKMNKSLDEVPEDTPAVKHPGKNATALIQHMLSYYNPAKAKRDAIWDLVPRQVDVINKHWDAQSEMNLGESEPSTESSSVETE